MLNKHYKFSFIVLLESFLRHKQVGKYNRILGMDQAAANSNSKILYFVDNNIVVEVISDSEQHITVKLSYPDNICYNTFFYA